MPVGPAERHHIARFPEFIVYFDQLAAHPLANRLTAQPNATFSVARQVMGKPEKIKSICLAAAPFTGHCALMGKKDIVWQDTAYVLELFGDTVKAARKDTV
jgi:hypothetical protein